jgi:hypothetical protein
MLYRAFMVIGALSPKIPLFLGDSGDKRYFGEISTDFYTEFRVFSHHQRRLIKPSRNSLKDFLSRFNDYHQVFCPTYIALFITFKKLFQHAPYTHTAANST